jgi:hypothetical protein
VRACPTEAIQRVDPTRDFAELSAAPAADEARVQPPAVRKTDALLWCCALLLVMAGLGAPWLHAAGFVVPSASAGVALGWCAALLCAAALVYVLPKRAVRYWVRLRHARSAKRSLLKPWLSAHVVTGTGAALAAALHGGLSFEPNWAGALEASFWLTIASGLLARACYDHVPSALSRLERAASLAEDLPAEREALLERFDRELTGRDELVKRIASAVLVPYARAVWGPIALIAAGRSLQAEQRHLRDRIERMLEGRGAQRLAGLDGTIRSVVELRAWPARRALHALLRACLPLHIVLTALCCALLIVHVVSVWSMR